MDPKPARVRIVDAAYELMLSIGLARTTTKEIARAAGCSEAALYKYFSGKEDLFVTVLAERLPRLGGLLDELAAGEGTVEGNLTAIARQAALFYEQTIPMTASLYAEPQLKRRHEQGVAGLEAGPHLPIQRLDAYLRAEQKTGRIRAGVDTYAAASLLLGACAQRAFAYSTLPGNEPPQSLDDFAASLAATLLGGIGPSPSGVS